MQAIHTANSQWLCWWDWAQRHSVSIPRTLYIIRPGTTLHHNISRTSTAFHNLDPSIKTSALSSRPASAHLLNPHPRTLFDSASSCPVDFTSPHLVSPPLFPPHHGEHQADPHHELLHSTLRRPGRPPSATRRRGRVPRLDRPHQRRHRAHHRLQDRRRLHPTRHRPRRRTVHHRQRCQQIIQTGRRLTAATQQRRRHGGRRHWRQEYGVLHVLGAGHPELRGQLCRLLCDGHDAAQVAG